MNESISIPKDLPSDDALSYDFLRGEFIDQIQQLAGATWTDHNVHDPGITILEQLCYALTDLAYRTDFDIQELLARKEGQSFQELYSPAAIFTTSPVTLQDIRKVVIDVHGVKNAWIEKVQNPSSGIKGLFKVAFHVDEWAATESNVLRQVRSRLMSSRGICEDFEEVTQLDTQPIALQGSIEVGKQVEDINELIASVLNKVGTFLSPRARFYTLSQMIDKGKQVEEVFDGPRLEHGFIDNEELAKHKRILEVQTSDLIREIMDVPGVKTIDSFAVATGTSTVKNWVLPVDRTKTPELDVSRTLKSLTFTIQGIPAKINQQEITRRYNELGGEGLPSKPDQTERDIVINEPSVRSLSAYHSIQEDFPSNYGIGNFELPEQASAQRKGQARQLSAYLMFFEQLLANYLTQLSNFKDLISFDGEKTNTYFNQSLIGAVTGLEKILVSTEGYETYLSETGADSTDLLKRGNRSLKRKNKFLNHLLARFGEDFSEYSLMMQDSDGESDMADKKLIADKARFLRMYPEISGDRFRASDYTRQSWMTDHVSGLEKRIAAKLGMEEMTRSSLSIGDSEGFHMIEHILLRPQSDDLSTFETYYTMGEVSEFKPAQSDGMITCTAPGHTLKAGELIRIVLQESESQSYEVKAVGTDSFEIEAQLSDLSPSGSWQRAQPDIRYMTFSNQVHAIVAGQNGQTRFTTAEHALQVGDTIRIAGTIHYDGTHEVTGLTEDGFEIAQAFQEDTSQARWIPQADAFKDPYSLQLTFVLPNGSGRFQDESYKQLVENTIRGEVAAHLKVHIKWLDMDEMAAFDQAYKRFLSDMSASR